MTTAFAARQQAVIALAAWLDAAKHVGGYVATELALEIVEELDADIEPITNEGN